MDLTFNIIFMPGTVRYLRLAVLSLLKYSENRYRLVGNGLDRGELAELRQFCSSSDRLIYAPYPVKTPVPHGVLLSTLQSRENGDYFCFMDSDIFASGPFQAELETCLRDCDVFSSCDLLRVDTSERLVGTMGRCLETATGMPLALTFFAVYRNELLRQLIRDTGVGFEVTYYPEHHNERIRALLRSHGLSDTLTFDTGKLLNVLSHDYHWKYRYRQIDQLMHVGGITKAFMKSGWMKERVAWFLRRPYVLRDEDLEPRTNVAARLLRSPREGSHLSEMAWNRRRARLRRRRIAVFYAFFLQALVDGTPEPVLEIEDAALASRIGKLCQVIRSLHQEQPFARAA